MVDTPIILYTHADASTLSFFATNVSIRWAFPNKTISRQPNKVGITTDRNDEYRVVTCTAILSGDDLNTLNTAMMPAAAPTYDATDPKILIYLDGDTSLTILCAITELEASHQTSGQWAVSVTFTERST